MNRRMLVIVAAATRLVSTLSASSPRTESTVGEGPGPYLGDLGLRQPGRAQAVVEGEVGAQDVEQPRRVGLARQVNRPSRRQRRAVRQHRDVGIATIDEHPGRGVVGCGRHGDGEPGALGQRGHPFDARRGVWPGEHDVLGVRAVVAEVGDDDDRGEGEGR
jgi:hypothetical protein